MKKTLISLCMVVLAVAFAGAASAADNPAAPVAAEAPAALAALADAAQSCAPAAVTLALATEPETEAVVCCTAADRAACTAECAPLIGKTFCIHGCECYCF